LTELAGLEVSLHRRDGQNYNVEMRLSQPGSDTDIRPGQGDSPSTSSDDAKIAARTVVKLDGDSQTVLPMNKGEDGALAVDAAVFEMHRQNVRAVIDYRAWMMSSLLSILRPQG
jgi:hypothetical protein